jgi:AcrR family transcriptional regulator
VGRRKTISDDDILAAARAVFAKHGHAASTRIIAKEAGLSQATLFQRFGHKERLFLAAIYPDPLDVDEIVGTVADAASGDGVECLTAIAVRLQRRIAETMPQVLQLANNPALGAEVIEAAHRHIGVPKLLKALIERVAELQSLGFLALDIRPDAAVESILIAAHGVTLMQLASPASVPIELTLRRFVVTMLREATKPNQHREADNGDRT